MIPVTSNLVEDISINETNETATVLLYWSPDAVTSVVQKAVQTTKTFLSV